MAGKNLNFDSLEREILTVWKGKFSSIWAYFYFSTLVSLLISIESKFQGFLFIHYDNAGWGDYKPIIWRDLKEFRKIFPSGSRQSYEIANNLWSVIIQRKKAWWSGWQIHRMRQTDCNFLLSQKQTFDWSLHYSVFW